VRRANHRRLAPEDEAWWRDAVFYQVYIRSFADAGNGVGDLEGLRNRSGYLELLGVDALWLTPFRVCSMSTSGIRASTPTVCTTSTG